MTNVLKRRIASLEASTGIDQPPVIVTLELAGVEAQRDQEGYVVGRRVTRIELVDLLPSPSTEAKP